MKSRKMIIAVLLFVAVAVSSATFAYWASTVQDPADDTATGTVNIGEGNTVTTTVAVDNVAAGDASTDPVLVPNGFEDGTVTPAKVNNKDKVFTVNWTGSGAEGATGTLTVSQVSLNVLDSTGASTTVDASSLFTITIDADQTITAGTPLTHTVNIEFTNEPANEADYDAIVNGTLVVELNFAVTVTP